MGLMRTPVVLENARFTVYSPGCVRLEYARRGKFSPYPSLLVGRKFARPARADVSLKKKSLHIRTPRFDLSYQDNGECFSPENLKIVHRNNAGGREVWVPGKQDKGNLGSVRRCLDRWTWCGGPEHYPEEGILSTEGGHYLADEPRVYWNKQHDWPECRAEQVDSDGYFFAYGDDYKVALKDFVTVFGKIPMVPRWAFGFWYSRWHAYKQQEFIDLVKRYRKERIPIDVVVVDTDWRDGWGGYDWTPKYFPKPRELFRKLHAMGIRAGLNDHPGYDSYDALPEGDGHLPAIEKRLGPLPHEGKWCCDWSNKKAVKTWLDVLLGPFFDDGIDFWWIDGWIKSPFGSIDSQLWANRQYYELGEKKTGKRGLILSRWGGIGSHRYPVQFSGDTASEWGVLKHQVEFTARSGNLGAVYWSHDIGGFFGRKIDEEIFIRWSQFGAMSPMFRTHSDHGIREPWKFSGCAKAIFRKQTRIRYALAPFFYTLAREAHDEGLPIIRPLYLEYNQGDGGALNRRQQYTIGRDLLVIPADGPVDKRNGLFRKRAYFPPGRWFGIESGEIIQGAEDRWIDIPVDLIPTYAREGAIIPCQQVGESIGTRVPEQIEFDYYPDPLKESEYELYEDDGESKDYEKRGFARTRVKGWRTEEQVFFTVGALRGSYRGMARKRSYVIRIRLEPGEKVAHVETKVDRKAWTVVSYRDTNKCLAGTAASRHCYCEVNLKDVSGSVRLRATLK